MSDWDKAFWNAVNTCDLVKAEAAVPGVTVLRLPSHQPINSSLYGNAFGPDNPGPNASLLAAYNLWDLCDRLPSNDVDFFADSGTRVDHLYGLLLSLATPTVPNSVAAAILRDAKAGYDNSVKGALDGSTLPWHIISANPLDWATTTDGGNQIDVSVNTAASQIIDWQQWHDADASPRSASATFSAVVAAPRAWPSAAPAPIVLPPIIGRPQLVRPTTMFEAGPLASPVTRVTATIRVVQLNRPWLDLTWLQNPGWYVNGATKGSVSGGNRRGADLFPAIPVAMILADNIAISAQVSLEGLQRVQTAMGAGLNVNLGPFSVHAANNPAATVTLNPDRLVLQGKYLVGWACKIVPQAPPADGPSRQRYRVTADVHFRSGPSLDSDEWGVVHKGEYIIALGSSGPWIRIIYGGREGYVHQVALEAA
jgi:hypothetical protein